MNANPSLNTDIKMSLKCCWNWQVLLGTFPHLFFTSMVPTLLGIYLPRPAWIRLNRFLLMEVWLHKRPASTALRNKLQNILFWSVQTPVL